jgi:MFS family permease
MNPIASSAPDGRDDPVPPARAWFAVGILFALTILSYLDRSIIALMIEPIKADLQITDIQISLLQGLAFALFYAVASVPMGWLADHFPRPMIIFCGASIWSLATAACGLSRSFAQLFVARIAVGAGEATLSPAAYALTADLFPPRKLSFALGVLAAGAAVGGALAFVVGGLVVSWAETVPPIFGLRSWQLVFVIVGLPGLLVAPFVFLIKGVPKAKSESPNPLAPAPHYGKWLMKNLGFILPLSLGVGFQCVVAIGVAAWTPSYLGRHFGLAVANIGLTVGLVQGIGGVIGFAGGGWLVDKLVARGVRAPHSTYLTVCAALMTIVGVTAFGLGVSLPVLFVMLGFLHLLMPVTGPALAQLQMFTPHMYRARTVALFMLIFNLVGMIIGPSSVALYTERVLGGPEHVGTGIALTVLTFGPLACVCLWISSRGARRLQAAGTNREFTGQIVPQLA